MPVVLDDAILVSRAVGGDREAFGSIYDRYSGAVLDLCTAVLGDDEEAADATLDAFLRAARELVNLQDRSELRRWILAVARHEATSRAGVANSHGVGSSGGVRTSGRGRRGQPRPPGGLFAGEGGPSRSDDDPRHLVWGPAASLSAFDRAVLHLHLRHELDGDDLARVLGVRRGPARARAVRLRAAAEATVGALLLSRAGAGAGPSGSGSDDRGGRCERLERLLEGWDGHLGGDLGARVHRHAGRCDVCGERREQLLGRLRAMASLPFADPPGWLRREVLLRMELAVSSRPLPGWSPDGYPPATEAPRRGRMNLGLVAAAVSAAVVLVAGGGYLVTREDGGDPSTIASGDATTATSAEITATTIPGSSSASSPTPTPIPASTSTPTSSTAPTTGPVDRSPPSITFGAAVASAYTAGCPYSVIGVSAEVADESAVTSVVLFVLHPNGSEESVAMVLDGGRYIADMGQFQTPGQARYWVEAVDAEGNLARAPHEVLAVVTC